MRNHRELLINSPNNFEDFSNADKYWAEVFNGDFVNEVDEYHKLVYSFNDGHHVTDDPDNFNRVRCCKEIWDYEILTSIVEGEQVAVIVEEEKHDDLKNPLMNPEEANNIIKKSCFKHLIRDVFLDDNNQEGYSYTSCPTSGLERGN